LAVWIGQENPFKNRSAVVETDHLDEVIPVAVLVPQSESVEDPSREIVVTLHGLNETLANIPMTVGCAHLLGTSDCLADAAQVGAITHETLEILEMLEMLEIRAIVCQCQWIREARPLHSTTAAVCTQGHQCRPQAQALIMGTIEMSRRTPIALDICR
jgi:hypothetical protein